MFSRLIGDVKVALVGIAFIAAAWIYCIYADKRDNSPETEDDKEIK